MNKKGQALGIAIVVAITFFMVGMISINFLRDEVTNARTSDKLNCGNASAISDGTKFACLAVDLVVPGFIITIILTAGGLIALKFI